MKELSPEEFDELVEQWHTGDHLGSLYEFLGWTKEEYAMYIENRCRPHATPNNEQS